MVGSRIARATAASNEPMAASAAASSRSWIRKRASIVCHVRSSCCAWASATVYAPVTVALTLHTRDDEGGEGCVQGRFADAGALDSLKPCILGAEPDLDAVRQASLLVVAADVSDASVAVEEPAREERDDRL